MFHCTAGPDRGPPRVQAVCDALHPRVPVGGVREGDPLRAVASAGVGPTPHDALVPGLGQQVAAGGAAGGHRHWVAD